jgi:hypothetical protein
MSASTDIAAYAAQVRAALADLPEQQRVELLEDLEDHLAEVVADAGPPLEARLGPPADYARDLRLAALAPATASTGRLQDALDGLRADVRRLWELEAAREVRAFLSELRPAWWVLRAWLLVAAAGLLLGGGPLLLPLGPVLGLPLLVTAVVLSVRLGRRAATHPTGSGTRVSYAANTALALLAVAIVVGVQQRDQGVVYAGPYDPYGYPGDSRPLAHEDGTPITNLYPYSSDGEPLSGVLLYDQDGRAVDNLATTTQEGEEVRPLVVPGEPPAPSNSYPQRQDVLRYDEFGGLAPPTPRPLPSGSPSPSPSGSPSGSPSASPSTQPATAAPDPAAASAPPSSPSAPAPSS